MSRAFVKEDSGGDEVLPDLPQSPHPNLVTPAGLAQLQARLDACVAAMTTAVAASADQAADQAASLRRPELSRDIRFLRERLRRAVVITPAGQDTAGQDPGVAGFGMTVTVDDEAGRTRAFTIVGEDEADPGRGLVSHVSPLARALLGARVGEEVVWRKPAGEETLLVTAIAPALASGPSA